MGLVRDKNSNPAFSSLHIFSRHATFNSLGSVKEIKNFLLLHPVSLVPNPIFQLWSDGSA